MAGQEKYTILYGRLSQEDTQKANKQDDSNSIQNQRALLQRYADERNYSNTRFIYDDGYSGTNFNRPGWQEVMELMENGQVETLIVKDMSRLGREYLQVGQYTEIIFPSYGVHFIAVNDGVDSNDASTCDFTPFRNLMNEFYAKDCSKKGRSVARLKAESGARVGSRPPYGYQKDPADPKRHIIPNGTLSQTKRQREWSSISFSSVWMEKAPPRSQSIWSVNKSRLRDITTTSKMVSSSPM